MTSSIAQRDGVHRGAKEPAPADHLLTVEGAPWSFWRRLLLRSAGFPGATVLQLAPPGARAAVDQLLAAEAQEAEALETAQERVSGALDQLRAAGRWEEAEIRKPLLKAQRGLLQGKLNRPVRRLAEETSDNAIREAIEALAAAREALEREKARFAEEMETALDAQSAALQRLASDERFQEAVIWQNRAGFATGIGKLLEDSPTAVKRDSQRRQKEELAASYLQRYCLKNDTIGFFGPLAWGEFRTEGDPLSLRPGPALIARRETFFESWCIDEIARTLLENPAVRPWLPPRKLPTVIVHGPMLFLPGQKPQPLPPPMAALLTACDGRRSGREIATALAEDPALGLESSEQVLGMLQEAAERRLIAWDFEMPIGPHAETRLREQIEAIGEPELRQQCLAILDRFRQHRREIDDTEGDADALNRALRALEEAFRRQTDERATRREGQNYSGRTLIYQECLRDVEFTVGPQIRDQLQGPLDLIQRSARWYIQRTAEHLRGIFGEIYDRLAAEGQPVVECGRFWQHIEPFLFGDQQHQLRQCMPEVHRRWEEILQIPEGEHRVEYRSADLRRKVEAAFSTEGFDLPMARYGCPDVMIAAEGYEALRRGEYQLVMGEFHPGRLTYNNWVFLTLCPFREEVFAWVDRDIPEPQVIPLPPKNNPIITTRTAKAHHSTKDYYIPPVDGSVIVPPERSLSLADVVLERQDGRLVARTRDGRLRWDIFEFFVEFVALRLVNSFGLLSKQSHRPRISIDGLVIRRESWSFPAEALTFAEEDDTAARFAAIRRWSREQGLPRFLFARTPAELKPFYVDLDSPIYVDLLAKAIRGSASHPHPIISLSEMLPDPHQLWLEDAEGKRYTSELRMIMKMSPEGDDQP